MVRKPVYFRHDVEYILYVGVHKDLFMRMCYMLLTPMARVLSMTGFSTSKYEKNRANVMPKCVHEDLCMYMEVDKHLNTAT